MIDDHLLAEPYAQAAFEYAAKHGTLAGWSEALAVLAIVVQNEQFQMLLSNPKVEQSIILNILKRVVNTQDPAINNFILLLANYKRLNVAATINELFIALKLAHEKILDVHVKTPFNLDVEQSNKLQAAFAAKYNQQVRLHIQIEPSLIGGINVRVGDVVIDNSILGKINRFKAHLNLKETV